MKVLTEFPEETTQMVRGRRQKPKTPTRLERVELLRDRILQLKDDLLEDGFGAVMPEPGAVKFTEQPDEDPFAAIREERMCDFMRNRKPNSRLRLIGVVFNLVTVVRHRD